MLFMACSKVFNFVLQFLVPPPSLPASDEPSPKDKVALNSGPSDRNSDGNSLILGLSVTAGVLLLALLVGGGNSFQIRLFILHKCNVSIS